MNEDLLKELHFARDFFDIFENKKWGFMGDQYKDLIAAYRKVSDARKINIGYDEEEG